MTDLASPRSDVIGSLLRPADLLDARARRQRGEIGEAELQAVEDRAVLDAIEMQERAGVDVVTDGEYRRDAFYEQFIRAGDGLELVPPEADRVGHIRWRNEAGEPGPTGAFVRAACTGKLRLRRSLSCDEFLFLRNHVRRGLPKVTLPAPSYLERYWVRGLSEAAYPTFEAYMADVVDLMRGEVAALARLGARYIQFDAPNYGMILDPTHAAHVGRSADAIAPRWVEADNAVLGGVPGVTFGIHMCRGNMRGMWMAEGGYDPVAPFAFRHLAHHRYLLEYDTDRAGTFEPLREVPADKTVVLGLVSTKRPEVEPAEAIVGRIREASRFVPIERLAVSPQCGFASVSVGNPIPWSAQEAKLALVARAAREVWGGAG
jgi:5-methyltetrahydropteroyltriglutamate--homocysteine methyltransferase